MTQVVRIPYFDQLGVEYRPREFAGVYYGIFRNRLLTGGKNEQIYGGTIFRAQENRVRQSVKVVNGLGEVYLAPSIP